jgi:two-component system sensor histidine kinase YesM
MIGRIRELINDNYHMQLRRKEAELLALQSQINPHFLHNTLESIRMTAEVDDNPEVADMIQLLGRLLRYSVNTAGEIVRLEDELMHLDTFMRIVEYRYPGRFRLRVEGCEPYRGMKMVKLLLQPIVENAVLHGYDERKESMTIALSCEAEGDRIVFRIRDDGAGLDAGTLERLRGVLDTPPSAKNEDGPRGFGIGLRNVNERIRLFYGEGYGIGVASGPDTGTEVTVTLPGRLQPPSAGR